MRSALVSIAVVLVVMLAGCHPQPLPEHDSPAAQVYVHQCGQCHSPYNPHAMTAAMWAIEVPKMEDKIRQARLPELDATQKATILDYLARNAGSQ